MPRWSAGAEDWMARPQARRDRRRPRALDSLRPLRRLANRANTEAAIRSKIKRMLRKPQYREAVRKYIRNGDGGGGLDVVAQRIFDQARTLYRYWPDVETDRLFEPGQGLS